MVRGDVRMGMALLLAASAAPAAPDVARSQERSASSNDDARPELRVILLRAAGSGEDELGWSRERLIEHGIEPIAGHTVGDSFSETARRARALAIELRAEAVLWVGGLEGQRALFLFESASQRTLARRLTSSGDPRVTREELAILVTSLVTALREGAEYDLEEVAEEPPSHPVPSEAPPPEPPPPAPVLAPPLDFAPRDPGPADAARSELAVRVGYAGGRWSTTGGGWQSGVGLGAMVRFPDGVHVELGYAIVPSEPLHLAGTSAVLSHHPGSVAIGGQVRAVGPFRWLGADLELTADHVVRSTQAGEAGLTATQREGRWLLRLGPRVLGALALTERLEVFVGAGADWLLTPFSYVVQGVDGDVRSAPDRLGHGVDLAARFYLL